MMKFIFWHAEKQQNFLQVDIIILGMCCQTCPKYPKYAYLCNISRKTWGIKLFFCLQINTKVFYSALVSFWVCVMILARSTQNNRFAVSLQYLKENGKNEVVFLLADKHQRLLQIDTIVLVVVRHAQIT